MAYRVTKAQEVQDCEKVIQQEMQVLQKRRDELEAELKAVRLETRDYKPRAPQHLSTKEGAV